MTTVRTLLSHDAEVDLKDQFGRTPLSFAAQLGHLDILVTLESQGGDLNSKDGREKSPLYHAAEAGQEKVVQYLLGHDGPWFHINDRDIITKQSAFWAAVGKEHWGVDRLLVDHGAKLLVQDTTSFFLRLLFDEKLSNVAELIKLGVDMNSANNQGQTLLSHAAEWGFDHFVEYLLSVGADPSIANKKGQTPLMYAVMGNSPECVDMLLQRDPESLSHQDRHGYTALSMAAQKIRRTEDTIKVLLR